MRQRIRQIVLITGVLLLAGFAAFFYTFANAAKQVDPLQLIALTNTASGPTAVFAAPLSRVLKRTEARLIESEFEVLVFRHKKWEKLGPEGNPVSFDEVLPKMINGKLMVMRNDGYQVTVKVPTCERWKVRLITREKRSVRLPVFSIPFPVANCWESEEIGGWSMIRQKFNTVSESR